jgi:molybdenum-dependent DNA-binding transcriptional regulator ModE
MGRTPSIDVAKGKVLLEAYGRLGSKRAAAEEVGVSIGSAMRFFESVPEAAAPAVTQQRVVVEAAGASLWDTRRALEDNYQRLLKLYQQLEAGILEERQGVAGPYVTMTPVTTNVAALREIREHVKVSVDLAKLLIDIEEVRKFQNAVLDAIHEADPATRERIIAKLRERRALGLALGGPGGTGAGG